VFAESDETGHTTQFKYDALGHLTAVTDALGNTTHYAYDEVGNQVSITDAAGNTTRFEYDAEGRMTKRLLPMGQAETFAYDAAGNRIAQTDFNGATILFAYNSQNRLIQETLPDGSKVTYAYTPDGERQTVTDSRGTTSYAYDSRGRLTSRSDPDGTTISYRYDMAGNITSVATPAGTTAYTYDSLNRLETVTDQQGGVTAYMYDPVGNLIKTQRPDGTAETRSYDARSRLVSLTDTGPGGVIDGYQYTLDPVGNTVVDTEASGRRVQYSYDALERLVSESIVDPTAGNRTITYTYDAVGNRLTSDDSAAGKTVDQYDANNRLVSETQGGVVSQYTYDDDGNLVSRTQSPTDRASYRWDALGRLVGADVTNAGVAHHLSYEYEADGNRVAQVVDGQETRYLIDANRPLAQVLLEYSPGGVIQVSYGYGLNLISQDRGGVRSFYHTDGLGSTRALTDPTGRVTDAYLYSAFGQLIGRTGTTVNNYLFAGQQFDPNLGQYFQRARYYDPAVGRFTAMDPFAGIDRNPLTLDKYLYTEDSPVNHSDPSGQWDLIGTLFVSGIVAILVGTSIPFALRGVEHSLHSEGLGLKRAYAADTALQFAASAALGQAAGGYLVDYATWFGAEDKFWAEPQERFVQLAWQKIFELTSNPTFRPGTPPAGEPYALAYVYPGAPTETIYFTEAAWWYPVVGVGVDYSLALIIVHELAHLAFPGLILDHEQGREESLELAKVNPLYAVLNAANYGWSAGV
jgi:RHS repeat-associated protein